MVSVHLASMSMLITTEGMMVMTRRRQFDHETSRDLGSGVVWGPRVGKRDIHRLTLVMKKAMEQVHHPNRCLPRMDLPEDSCSLWSDPVVKVARRHRWSGSGEAHLCMGACTLLQESLTPKVCPQILQGIIVIDCVCHGGSCSMFRF